MKHLTLLLLPLMIASGCTPYGESFDCPPGHGVGCKSLSQVNHMVEEGELPLEIIPLEATPPKQNLIEARNGPISLIPSRGTPSKAASSREAPLKVWMTTYKDEEGIIHGPSMLYVNLSDHSQVNP